MRTVCVHCTIAMFTRGGTRGGAPRLLLHTPSAQTGAGGGDGDGEPGPPCGRRLTCVRKPPVQQSGTVHEDDSQHCERIFSCVVRPALHHDADTQVTPCASQAAMHSTSVVAARAARAAAPCKRSKPAVQAPNMRS